MRANYLRGRSGRGRDCASTRTGPVTLEGGVSKDSVVYHPRSASNARTEAEGAPRCCSSTPCGCRTQGPWTVLPRPAARSYRLSASRRRGSRAAAISTSDGRSRPPASRLARSRYARRQLSVDRIRGDSKLITGGGDIQVGQVGGALRCTTARARSP